MSTNISKQKREDLLDTHTPVLTEDKKLFIDNGGQMNFLIEGDSYSFCSDSFS